MEQDGVIGDGVAEGSERRHLHVVLGWNVAGLRAAVPNIDTEGGTEALGMCDAFCLRQGRISGGV